MNRSSTPDTIELELKLGLRDCDPLRVSDALNAVLGRTIPGRKDLLFRSRSDIRLRLTISLGASSAVSSIEMRISVYRFYRLISAIECSV